jgi:hypothetical protein
MMMFGTIKESEERVHRPQRQTEGKKQKETLEFPEKPWCLKHFTRPYLWLRGENIANSFAPSET